MVEPSSIALSELRSSPDAAEGAEQRNEAPAAGATVPADTPGAAEEFKTAELHAYVSKFVQARLSTMMGKLKQKITELQLKDTKIAELTLSLRRRTDEARRHKAGAADARKKGEKKKAEAAALEEKLQDALRTAKDAQERGWLLFGIFPETGMLDRVPPDFEDR